MAGREQEWACPYVCPTANNETAHQLNSLTDWWPAHKAYWTLIPALQVANYTHSQRRRTHICTIIPDSRPLAIFCARHRHGCSVIVLTDIMAHQLWVDRQTIGKSWACCFKILGDSSATKRVYSCCTASSSERLWQLHSCRLIQLLPIMGIKKWRDIQYALQAAL